MDRTIRIVPVGALLAITIMAPLPAVASPAVLIHMCGGGSALLHIPANRPPNRGTAPCCLKNYVGRDDRKRLKKGEAS